MLSNTVGIIQKQQTAHKINVVKTTLQLILFLMQYRAAERSLQPRTLARGARGGLVAVRRGVVGDHRRARIAVAHQAAGRHLVSTKIN